MPLQISALHVYIQVENKIHVILTILGLVLNFYPLSSFRFVLQIFAYEGIDKDDE